MRERVAGFQQSALGLFFRKVMDDRVTALAVLIAWGTLTTLIPLLLGVMALLSLVLRDPQRESQFLAALVNLLPTDSIAPVRAGLEQTQGTAGIAGIVSLALLLFNGSNFFANLEWVFDMAYHVEDRNLILQRLRGVVMLVVAVGLASVSTAAFSLAGLLSSPANPVVSLLPANLPVGSAAATAESWFASIVCALAMFWLLYRLLPNKPQTWREALPGALLATLLFFLLLEVFPLYMALFGNGFQAYAAFGFVMVLTFWLYLLGFAFVLGAELNAYLEAPARSTAMAQAQARAEQGKVKTTEDGGEVHAEADGSAPANIREPILPWSPRRRAG